MDSYVCWNLQTHPLILLPLSTSPGSSKHSWPAHSEKQGSCHHSQSPSKTVTNSKTGTRQTSRNFIEHQTLTFTCVSLQQPFMDSDGQYSETLEMGSGVKLPHKNSDKIYICWCYLTCALHAPLLSPETYCPSFSYCQKKSQVHFQETLLPLQRNVCNSPENQASQH